MQKNSYITRESKVKLKHKNAKQNTEKKVKV